ALSTREATRTWFLEQQRRVRHGNGDMGIRLIYFRGLMLVASPMRCSGWLKLRHRPDGTLVFPAMEATSEEMSPDEWGQTNGKRAGPHSRVRISKVSCAGFFDERGLSTEDPA